MALFAAPVLLAACAADLEPPASARAASAAGEDAARASMAGVTVTTMAMDSWPGPYQVTEELTPMKVRIQNNSRQPLFISYIRFELVAADGKPYRALPLFGMEGSVPTKMTIRNPSEIRDRSFSTNGFEVAPVYRPIYPDMGVYGGPIVGDPSYYKLYETYYGSKPLPTPEMRRRALPEGVLAPGGSVEGYLFFEEVPASAARVTFRFDLFDPAGRNMGVIRIPFAAWPRWQERAAIREQRATGQVRDPVRAHADQYP